MQLSLAFVLSIPTLLIYYFNFALNHSLMAMVATIFFIFLLTYSLVGLLWKIDSSLARIVSSYTLFTLFAAYLFSVLVSYYLQGSYLNQQFFFHFRLSTLTEAWPVAKPLLALMIGWLALVWFCLGLMLRKSLKMALSPATSAPTIMVLAALVCAPQIDPDIRAASIAGGRALLFAEPLALELIDWEGLELDRRALSNNLVNSNAGKNLLMIYLEGLERLYMDESVFPDLTPNISALNESGWQQLDMQQTKGGAWTMAGIVSSMCGTPLVYESILTGNQVMYSNLLNQTVCLPDVLHNAGYHQVFMGGASTEFAGKGNFLSQHSFDEVLGREELLPRLENQTTLNSWGIYDDSLFELALAEFERLAATDEPFNLTLLTVDTHHPIGEPSPNCPVYSPSDNTILQSVHCTDDLVGRFITLIQSHPAYQDTIVVLMSDHLAMRNNAFPLFPENYDRKLYFNVLNADSIDTSQFTSTTMDIAPTVLDLLGVDHDIHFLAGSSLLEPQTATRNPVLQHPERTTTIGHLNSNYLSSSAKNEVFTLNARTIDDINFINQIDDVSYSSHGMEFNSLGSDPYFLLPDIPPGINADLEIFLELKVSDNTAVSLFYTTEEDKQFSEQRQMIRYIEAGENYVHFTLEADSRVRSLRIDPGHLPGRYTINKIEIRF